MKSDNENYQNAAIYIGYSCYKVNFEKVQIKELLTLCNRDQRDFPSFVAAIWSTLLFHYSAQKMQTIELSNYFLNDCSQCCCLSIEINEEDSLYDLAQKIRIQINDTASNDGNDTVTDTRIGMLFLVGQLDNSKIALCFDYNLTSLECTFQYKNSHLSEAEIITISGHLQMLLTNVLNNMEKPLLYHSYLTENEWEKFKCWNNTDWIYPTFHSVFQLFEEQTVRTPEAIALEFRQQKLSYFQLNCRANRIARVILDTYCKNGEKILQPDTLIAIIMDRSADVLTSMLGVMKAGGAYLPIDPQYPDSRIQFFLEDANASLILTKSKLVIKLKELIVQSDTNAELPLICVDDFIEDYSIPDDNLNIRVMPSDLAYVIYTSGSSGKPKGVLIEHAGLTALIPFLIDKFHLTPNTRVTQFASISFDASVYEWIGTLAAGGTLVVLSEEEIPPYSDISDVLEQKSINLSMLPPSILRTMRKQRLPELHTIVSAGETCTSDIVDYWAKDRLFLNAYGPTEVTVVCCVGVCVPGKRITIGGSIYNKHLYVLNSFGNLVPVGIPGELWVGGVGLARGYINQEELTDKCFVYKEIGIGDEYPLQRERIYNTGDIVKWTPDGELVYIGRRDDQVKIRGFRIELGEIEHCICQYPGISQCVVRAWSDNNYHKLVAYYTSVEESDETGLLQYVNSALPAYMVPSYFLRLEFFPLNINGKINYSKLPLPDEAWEQPFEEPRNMDDFKTEDLLLMIWGQLLKRKNIQFDDHFYAIGGDSILAIQMVSLARSHGLLITPRQVAEHSTIKDLAAVAIRIDCEAGGQTVDLAGEFGLTPIQNWFFEQHFEEPNYFNQSHMLILNRFDPSKMETAVKQLVRIHPELTEQFIRYEHSYLQKYRIDTSIRIDSYIIKNTASSDIEVAEVCGKWQRQLDFESGTVFYIGVIYGHSDGKVRVFLTIHHLVIDGVSWRILLKDLHDLYQGKEVLPVMVTFKKWQAAITGYLKGEYVCKNIEYWLGVQSKFSEFILPVDYCVEDNNMESAELVAALSQSDTQCLLYQCSHAYHTQINDLLISAWILTLAEWSKKETIIFQLESHGREACVSDMDLSKTIGWFTSLFPVCIQISLTESLGEQIKSVKEQLRLIPNKGISYGILRYCHPDASVRESLTVESPQALFNYLGQFDRTSEENEWLNFTNDASQDRSSARNHGVSLLELNSSIVGGQLRLFMKYSKHHYDELTISKILESLISNLLSIIKLCSQKDHEEFTSSDFPLVSLEQGELDNIINAYHIKYGIEKILPLSMLQEGLLFHYLEEPSSDRYFVQMKWVYKGRLDTFCYQEAWQSVINENDCLRTCFVWDRLEKPIQCVVKKIELNCTLLDISGQTKEQQTEYMERMMALDRDNHFSLHIPAHRLKLLKNSQEEWTVVWSYHHILLDGWSIPLLLNRVHDIYICKALNMPCQRSSLLSFETYIRWLKEKNRFEAENFWKSYLADINEISLLPFDQGNRKFERHQPVFKQQIETLRLDTSFKERMLLFTKEWQISLNTLIQFAWGKVLQVFQDEDITVFGMVVSGRGSDIVNADRISGLLINTLPLVLHWNRNQTVSEALSELHLTIQKISDYCFFSLNELKSWSSIKENSFFDSIVAFENYINDFRQPKCKLRMSKIEEYEKSNYPLTITISAIEEELIIKFAYDIDRLNQKNVSNLSEYLQHALQFIMEHPDSSIEDICLLNKVEYNKIVYEWNDTFTNYPDESSVYKLFENQVKISPFKPAVVTIDRTVAYGELKQLSGRIAELIMNGAPVHGNFIGVCLPRSLEFIVAILGILRAGLAYMPIDPDYPSKRKYDMIQDAGLNTIITFETFVENIREASPKLNLNLICIDDLNYFETKENDNGWMKSVSSRDLAYLMYTSGSTGKPKGVMIEHRGITRLVKNTNYFPFLLNTRLLYTGSPVFDASTFEIWGMLLNGGSLYVVSQENLMNLYLLENQFKNWGINALWLSAALFNQWVEENDTIFAGLKWLIVGGNVLSPRHINHIRRAYPELSIINGYGPTENTTFSTSLQIEREYEYSIPIGKPISNTTCYILDKRGHIQPVGAIGEIYVGGDGVARGYWNQELLTNDSFVPNVYASPKDIHLSKNLVLYRTGDRGRRLPDGNIEFMGRKDDQLKIHGFRIEPAEIQSIISTFPCIRECLVISLELYGDVRLIAYYTADKNIRKEQLKSFMKEALPSWMLPFRYVQLEFFPLTVNGKIDRNKLPLPDICRNDLTGELESKNELEHEIEQIWCNVLKLQHISKREDFYELGGHSLHALRIVSMLQKKGYPITVNQLLKEQTIEHLALCLSSLMPEASEGCQPDKEILLAQAYQKGGFPLSAVQKRFFKRNIINYNMFNIPFMAVLKKHISRRTMDKALEMMVNRHAALRLVFAKNNAGEWHQYEQMPEINQIINYVDLKEISQSHDNFISKYSSDLQYGFDIGKSPLWKVILFENYEKGQGQLLLLLFHHLIFDGISMNIFLSDLKNLLISNEGIDNSDKDTTSSYREWCLSLARYVENGVPGKIAEYWKNIVREGESLKVDKRTNEWPVHSQMVTLTFDLLESKELVNSLKTFAVQQKTTVFCILLTALSHACFALKRQSDLLLHTMSCQRESFFPGISIYRTIGFFAGAYPIRLNMTKEEFTGNFKVPLNHVKLILENIPREGMEYFVLRYLIQDIYPNTEIFVDNTHMLFHYQSEETVWQADDLYAPLDIPFGKTNDQNNPSAYLLNMTASMKQDRLSLTCYYSSLHFEEESINSLVHLLKEFLQHCTGINKNKEL